MSDIPPFTLQRLINKLRDRWRVSATIVSVFAVLGVIYLHLTPKSYTVTMQVVAVPNEETASPSGSGVGAALLSQFGAKSSETQSKFELYLAGLQSIETAYVLSQNSSLMHRMFAGEWSDHDKAWREPTSLGVSVARPIKELLGINIPRWQPPDAVRVDEFLQGNIAVSRSLVSPVVIVSIQAGDPQFGITLLNQLHSAVDGIIRRRTLLRASSYSEYLNSLIPKATVVEYRTALAETLMQQEKTLMAAASNAPYAAELFGRPTSSRAPTKPDALMILLVSVLVGVIVAIGDAILLDRAQLYRQFFSGSRENIWTKGRRADVQ